MKDFILELRENTKFVAVCVAIIAGLFLLAKILEWVLPRVRKISATRKLCIISICSAIAAVLHMLDFPLPFLAPDFYKLDLSELPVMLCGMYLGPAAAVICEALKILLKLLFNGTSTAFVGDFANFFVGCALVLPATAIYHIKHTRASAIWGLVAGTFALTVFGSAFNAIYLLPKFSQLYGIPLESIIGMGNSINGNINSVSSFVLFAVAPLNLIKGVGISILTILLYKKVARPLFGIRA